MKNLVKKIRNLEHKVGGLLQENKKLVAIVKNGVGDGVKELERLVVEQNQEIVRYRMCMANFSVFTNARKDL